MKFELKPYNRNTPGEELIFDVKKVADELNKETVTIDEYNERGKFHPTTLTRRFENWFKVLELAGLQIRDRESTRALAVSNGINFLAKGQEKDGSFFCLVSTKLDDYSKAKKVPAIVPTNFVLSSLIHIQSVAAERIKRKAAKFLLGERGEYWSFNYWFRKSDWYKKEPYPDDTDDTFVPLAALYEYNPDLFDGEVMARITTMLTSAEKEEGGPYDMWLVPPDARDKWNDTDLVCNANIAYFLSLQDISLPKLDAFIDKSINENDYEFPYNTIYPAIYFISRFYPPSPFGKPTEDKSEGQVGGVEGKARRIREMINLLLKKQEADGKWENPLRTALAISSLINLEGFKHPPSLKLRRTSRRQIEKGVDYLIKTQELNGSWEPYSFYFQMRTKKKTLFAGSPFITTALCLEAIHKFQKSEARNSKSETIPKSKIKNLKPEKENKIYTAVLKEYQRRFSGFSKDFQKKAFAMADKILKNHKDIVLLPYYFASSLHQNRNSKFIMHNSDLLIRLGEANLFGWIAYTIYDDFLDEEGDPKELPLANVCLLESAEIFESVLPNFSKNIFDVIDGANMWEVAHCRKSEIRNPKSETNSKFKIPDYGDYSQLANKSLGHALGPMAILFALGYGENSKEVKGTMRFFKNYIIARQLNDDAHDWEDDLKRGQVNAVGARLLRDAKGKTDSPEKLREIFWHKTIVGACGDILRHAELAKKDLKKLSIIKEPEIFVRMLVAIERSAEEALKEREETMKFLKTYSSPHLS